MTLYIYNADLLFAKNKRDRLVDGCLKLPSATNVHFLAQAKKRLDCRFACCERIGGRRREFETNLPFSVATKAFGPLFLRTIAET